MLGLAAGLGAAAVSGCRPWDTDEPAPDPLTPFLAQTALLAARYAQAIAADPALAARLRPVQEAHQAHAAALAAAVGAPTPAPSLGATLGPTSGPDGAPTLAVLRRAEEGAQRAARAACLAAPENRATLLGEIAAARAAHVEALR